MADKNRYPQIPSTVWWGVRSILQKTPKATIDERLLGVQLGVQEAAARAYVSELRSVGILSEDGRATDLAQKWRLDDTYNEAVEQIVTSTYPEGLVHLAPPGEAERQKVVSWFSREGLGQGAAGNKAATYLLLSSPEPNDAARVGKGQGSETPPKAARAQAGGAVARRSEQRAKRNGGDLERNGSGKGSAEAMPLNVNVQIHISADAGTEQIESIFKAMRRYLYESPDT